LRSASADAAASTTAQEKRKKKNQLNCRQQFSHRHSVGWKTALKKSGPTLRRTNTK
jgi:hypothetical protein